MRSSQTPKRVIKIHRTISRKECRFIINNYPPNESIVHLQPGTTVPEPISHYPSQTYELADDLKKKINYECFEKMLAFGDLQILNDVSVSKHLQFEKLNLWYYNKLRIYFDLRNKTYQQVEIKSACSHFDEVVLFSDSNELIHRSDKLTWFQKQIRKGLPNFSLAFRYLWVIIKRIFRSLLAKHSTLMAHLVMTGPNRYQPYLSLKTLQLHRDDQVLGYAIERFHNRILILDEYQIPGFRKNEQLPRETHHQTRRRIYGEYIMFKGLISSNLRKRVSIVLKEKMEILRKMRDLISNPEYMFIVNKLIELKKSHWYFIIRYEAFKKFFLQNQHFKTITGIDENGQFYKSIFDAAKFHNIKTIAIQHGNIYDLHCSYMFTKSDISNDPFTTITLTWGSYWRDFLVSRGNYPANRVEICGQLRTDIINRLNVVNRSSAKFRLLFASQPQRDPNLRLRATTDIFRAAKNLDDSELIIKLHPRETDHDYFHDLARSIGTSNYRLSYNDDLYEMISKSDVVVTCFSTVAGEAVYFNKPVVILDHLKQDLMKYHEAGVAFQATNCETLLEIIRNIMTGKFQINKEAYDSFIEQYAFKIDGQVCDRVMSLIESDQQIL